MGRRTRNKRLWLWFRPSIHHEEEVSLRYMPTMTSLHLLVADLRHAELCVLGWKSVVRHSIFVLYPNQRAGFSLHRSTPVSTNPLDNHRPPHNPLIQSP